MIEKKPIIKLEHVSKMYKLFGTKTERMKEALDPFKRKYHKEFYALTDINLEVREGEILGIVGMNGSGKSTLLKIVAGIIQSTAGSVMVKGNIVPLLELGSGFNPEFTGLENIYFYNTIMGYSRKKTDAILDEILDFAEIGDFIHQPIKTYSSGMKARLAFAVSVNINPDILILDEVLSVGDELFRRKCYARMEEFFKEGKTILFVSHSVQSINQLCTRAVFLNSGEIILEGPTKMVTAQYERYLFAKKENLQAVRRKIVMMNQDDQLKLATYAEIEKQKAEIIPGAKPVVENQFEEQQHSEKSKEDTSVSKRQDTRAESADIEISRKAAELITPKAYLIPNLVPKSRIEYRVFDVDITDICIVTPEGKHVNVLLTGEQYIYRYKVQFNMDAENVVFGMMVKTEKGFEVSVGNTKKFDAVVDKVVMHEIYTIEWLFTCNFLHGTYYTNAGVAEYKNGKYVYLNRVVDAMIFKVQQSDKFVGNGLVYIGQTPKIVLL